MFNQLSLLARSAGAIARNRLGKRELHTRAIYPYPYKYMEKIFPVVYCYRESHLDPPWKDADMREGKLLMRIFWTYFFLSLFNDPGVITGHWHAPDVEKWTDEELGIPPLSEGPYSEWLEKQMESKSSESSDA